MVRPIGWINLGLSRRFGQQLADDRTQLHVVNLTEVIQTNAAVPVKDHHAGRAAQPIVLQADLVLVVEPGLVVHPEGRHRDDFSVFDSPDAVYARYGSNLSSLKRWLSQHVIRHAINRNVASIRASKW